MAQITVSEVKPYTSNPKYGYCVLSSVQSIIQNGWIQEKSRTTILRGDVQMLAKLPKSLSGTIAVTECTEDNIPVRFSAGFDATKSLEENIQPYLKRAGENGPVLMSAGKRILRFTEYDASGSQTDVRVPHDNVEEVKAFNALNKGTAKK